MQGPAGPRGWSAAKAVTPACELFATFPPGAHGHDTLMRDVRLTLETTDEVLHALRGYDARDHAIEELERNIVRQRAELIAAIHEVGAQEAQGTEDRS